MQAVVTGAPPAQQASLLRASAARHAEVAREAARGLGFDRHLFALKDLAPDAAFFDDPTYKTLAANELSTSVLTLQYTRQSSFGPVHPEGFGVAYHVPPTELRFCTTDSVRTTLRRPLQRRAACRAHSHRGAAGSVRRGTRR